jgi:hypothetical protein
MCKIRFCQFISAALISAFLYSASGTAAACSAASKLTDDDARILLYVTPAAVAARQAGTDVDIEPSAPSEQFPASDYFVAALVSQKPTSGSVLGNGILGYFAVDKRSGEVESTTDFTSVNGKELSRVQAYMRRSHCITAAIPAAQVTRGDSFFLLTH